MKASFIGSAYEYLVDLIGGVILLGTPHRGSKSQKWGEILARLASLIEMGETVLMDDVDESSMKIYDLVSTFMKIMNRKRLSESPTHAAIAFFENLPTNYVRRVVKLGGWLSDKTSALVCIVCDNARRLTADVYKVVEEVSAVPYGMHSLALDSDHLKLNKFASAEDENYVRVSSNLARIAAQAPQLFQDRQRGWSFKPLSVKVPIVLLTDSHEQQRHLNRRHITWFHGGECSILSDERPSFVR